MSLQAVVAANIRSTLWGTQTESKNSKKNRPKHQQLQQLQSHSLKKRCLASNSCSQDKALIPQKSKSISRHLNLSLKLNQGDNLHLTREAWISKSSTLLNLWRTTSFLRCNLLLLIRRSTRLGALEISLSLMLLIGRPLWIRGLSNRYNQHLRTSRPGSRIRTTTTISNRE